MVRERYEQNVVALNQMQDWDMRTVGKALGDIKKSMR
jgi:hypothetical protein